MSAAGATVDLVVEEKVLGRGAAARTVLADVALRLAPGEVAAIMGPSGAGKTTLLRLLTGLDARFTGRRAPIDGRIGMVFQEPELLPWRTVAQNLALVAPRADRAAITAVLARCRLGADLLDRFPESLSLGERRRVALARALLVDPALLVLDEPLVSLDAATGAALREVIAEVAAKGTTTVVMVTHDLDDALLLADRLLRLDGRPARLVADHRLDRPRAGRDAAWLAAARTRWGAS